MGEISDEELHDVVEEVMLEEIQTLRVGLEDWKQVASDWATENLATAKKLVEVEVEVATLRAEVERLREKVSDMHNLARLVAASEKVHPTPWTVLADGAPPDDMRFAAYIDDDDENGVVQPGIRLDSAKLIVAVVNALPALLTDHARLTAEVARLRGLVAAITNLITNPAPIEHGPVMTDEISEPFAEGDADLRSSQTCACSSAYREIAPGIHAQYCALAGQPLHDGRQRWRCTACAAVSTVDLCPQCGGASVQEGRS